MKIIETLTPTEKFWLINEDLIVGIFIDLFTDEDALYDYNLELCKGYYFAHSGNKYVSIYYKNILETVEDNSTESANSIITGMLRSKFMHKWDSIYKSLKEEYSVLDEYKHDEKRTNTESKFSNGGRNNTRSSTTEESGQEEYAYKNTQKVLNDTDTSSVWAFNSNNSVPREQNESTSEIETLRLADNNYSLDDRNSRSQSTDNETHNDNYTLNNTTTYEKSGRHTAPSKLISDEVELRIKYIIADIIYKDIDSIMALQIY